MAEMHPMRRKSDRGWKRYSPEWLPERFYRDVWLLIITCVVIGSSWFGYRANENRINDIQGSRARNTLAGCMQTNREHTALVGFIRASIPPSRRDEPRVMAYLERAERSFPVVDCRALTMRRVQSP